MGVHKTIIIPGVNGRVPDRGDVVAIEYTGWIYDGSKKDGKGDQFDTSNGRGYFKFKLGLGTVIRGWDEGILGIATPSPMKLGEKSTLFITSDYAYGSSGFPGHIPPNASLIFDVELKDIQPAAKF